MKKLLTRFIVGLLLCGACSLEAFSQSQTKTAVLSSTLAIGPVWGLSGTGITQHMFTWNAVGTVSAGACKLQQSVDFAFTSPTDLIAAVTVTTSGGPTALTTANANYARLNCTTPITGSGTVSFNYIGLTPTGPTPGQNFSCVVTVSTATTLTAVGGSCVAPGAGRSLWITDIAAGSSAAAGTAADSMNTIKYGTGGTCGSGTTVVWPILQNANTESGATFSTPIQIPANNELCWINSTAGTKTWIINGYIR